MGLQVSKKILFRQDFTGTLARHPFPVSLPSLIRSFAMGRGGITRSQIHLISPEYLAEEFLKRRAVSKATTVPDMLIWPTTDDTSYSLIDSVLLIRVSSPTMHVFFVSEYTIISPSQSCLVGMEYCWNAQSWHPITTSHNNGEYFDTLPA